jgi:hypothetical protein
LEGWVLLAVGLELGFELGHGVGLVGIGLAGSSVPLDGLWWSGRG